MRSDSSRGLRQKFDLEQFRVPQGHTAGSNPQPSASTSHEVQMERLAVRDRTPSHDRGPKSRKIIERLMDWISPT